MEMQIGHYLVGLFIQIQEAKFNDKTNFYALFATGGREGAVSAKFNPDDTAVFDFLKDCSMGDMLLARVRPSVYKDKVYYNLENVIRAPLGVS